jgi:hypothetical protein
LPSPEKPIHWAEQTLAAVDATNFHTALNTLLKQRGHPNGKISDGQYYTLGSDNSDGGGVKITNYLTNIVHFDYRPNPAKAPDVGQTESLVDNAAVFDIELPGIEGQDAYCCFRPKDIEPDVAPWMGIKREVLANLPQNQYILFGPGGLVNMETDVAILNLVDRVTHENQAA